MDDSKIVKNIIHTGTKAVTFVPGTKVRKIRNIFLIANKKIQK